MKAKIIIVVICLTLSAVALQYFIKNMYNNNDEPQQTTEYSGDTLTFDFSDLRKCVGFVDYVFVGTVEEQVGTSYRNGEVYYDIGEKPDESGVSVYTQFSVTVKENIKGDLRTDISIPLYKNAGVDKRTNKLVMMQYDSMPLVGKDYIFLCNVHEDGKLVIVAPVGNIFLYEESRQGSIDAYRNAYENEIEYEKPEHYLSEYDVGCLKN